MKLKDKSALFLSLYTGNGYYPPYKVTINPSLLCNLACPMCWQNNYTKEYLTKRRHETLKLKDYERLFRELREMGTKYINVAGGGEPLMHPEILEILKSIKTNGFKGELVTNGILLNKELSCLLIDSGWDFIRFSIDAGENETYSKVKGINSSKGLFDRLVKAINALVSLKKEKGSSIPIVAFNFVLQSLNKDRISEFVSLAERLSIDEIDFKFISPFGNISLRDELFLNIADKRLLIQSIKKVRDRLSKVGISTYIPSDLEVKEEMEWPFCILPWSSSFIEFNGDVFPCCYSKKVMGNINNHTFGMVWKGIEYRNYRNRLRIGQLPEECIKCEMKYTQENSFYGGILRNPLKTSAKYFIKKIRKDS